MYRPLDEQAVIAYVQSLPDVMNVVFEPGEALTGVDLADGNINLVFRVHSASDPLARSVIIKQALPYARIVGESFPLPLDRSGIEANVLRIEAQYTPDRVPRLYHHDPDMSVIVMEDLNRYVIMRKGLVKQTIYPHFAEHIGVFMARTLFYTSDLYLPHDIKKQQVAKHINPALCKVTEDLVFTDPYTDNPGNVWNRLLDPQVEQLRADNDFRSELYLLKEEFMTKGEALIHGDLHTGSIMINPDDTRVIDPEFAFYGPMAFDVGLVMANLAISYCSQEVHAADPGIRANYQRWLLNTMRETWAVFEREFRKLWATELNSQWATDVFREVYIRRLLRHSAGYGSAELMRRILGLAHTSDLESIPDPALRAAPESKALHIGYEWLMHYREYTSIEDIVRAVENARSSYPYQA